MLTREQRDKWAEELESGRHPQITGQFCDLSKGYCCLGVLAHVVLGLPVADRDGGQADPFSELRLERGDDYRFWRMNDVQGMKFPEIAKHVRALPTSDGEP
jgi:hypothetical protein